jgi:hypothetical protein
MNDLSPVPASNPADAHRVLRLVALGAVILGLLVLAAAAIASSYGGIHALALTAGVSPALARIYPLAFDAMGVVASAAVLSLRGAGVIMRCYAWLAMLVLLCAAAGADALHATGARLPHRAAAHSKTSMPGCGARWPLRHAPSRRRRTGRRRTGRRRTGRIRRPIPRHTGCPAPARKIRWAPRTAMCATTRHRSCHRRRPPMPTRAGTPGLKRRLARSTLPGRNSQARPVPKQRLLRSRPPGRN